MENFSPQVNEGDRLASLSGAGNPQTIFNS